MKIKVREVRVGDIVCRADDQFEVTEVDHETYDTVSVITYADGSKSVLEGFWPITIKDGE